MACKLKFYLKIKISMKHLLTIAFIFLSVSRLAAQYDGIVKVGERCNRDVVEGGAYGIGHKGKTPNVAEEKDDGQCWASQRPERGASTRRTESATTASRRQERE